MWTRIMRGEHLLPLGAKDISVDRIKDLVSLLLFRLFFPLINGHCYFEFQYKEVKEKGNEENLIKLTNMKGLARKR